MSNYQPRQRKREKRNMHDCTLQKRKHFKQESNAVSSVILGKDGLKCAFCQIWKKLVLYELISCVLAAGIK